MGERDGDRGPNTPGPIESELDRGLSAKQRRQRAAIRGAYREMIRIELQDAPISWWRRRTLLSYAAGIGMDPFEARLLLRAVEYECGHTPPAAMADVDTPAELNYVARPEPAGAWFSFLSGFILTFAAAGAGLWLASR